MACFRPGIHEPFKNGLSSRAECGVRTREPGFLGGGWGQQADSKHSYGHGGWRPVQCSSCHEEFPTLLLFPHSIETGRGCQGGPCLEWWERFQPEQGASLLLGLGAMLKGNAEWAGGHPGVELPCLCLFQCVLLCPGLTDTRGERVEECITSAMGVGRMSPSSLP